MSYHHLYYRSFNITPIRVQCAQLNKSIAMPSGHLSICATRRCHCAILRCTVINKTIAHIDTHTYAHIESETISNCSSYTETLAIPEWSQTRSNIAHRLFCILEKLLRLMSPACFERTFILFCVCVCTETPLCRLLVRGYSSSLL